MSLQNFISHMVQMKVSKYRSYTAKRQLYIPHGSDESRERLYKAWIDSFFISHMVQMKALLFYLSTEARYDFISHMVQMKVPRRGAAKNQGPYFISHMVQMKVLIKLLLLKFSHSFISHMVQMKA